MKKNLSKHYNESFYGQHIVGMSRSAEIVLGLLYKHYKPESVIDIGCGQGAWLAAAESLGAKTLKGMDGKWVNKEKLLSNNIDFKSVNFDEAIPKLNEKYSLCISLEVAEHISESKAKDFINLLCEASNTVLFSAAIEYQGGTHHVNEQRQSYWVGLFKDNGYECFDIFRKELWDNNSVEWWYKQNTLLFLKPNNSHLNLDALRALEGPILDVVHPTTYNNKVSLIEHPTLRFCLRCIMRYIKNKL